MLLGSCLYLLNRLVNMVVKEKNRMKISSHILASETLGPYQLNTCISFKRNSWLRTLNRLHSEMLSPVKAASYTTNFGIQS